MQNFWNALNKSVGKWLVFLPNGSMPVHRGQECCLTALGRNVASLTFDCSCSGWVLSLCQASTRVSSPLALTCTLGQDTQNAAQKGAVTCSGPAPAWVLWLCCLDKHKSRWKWWVNCYRWSYLFVKQDNIYCLLFAFFLISSQSKHPVSLLEAGSISLFQYFFQDYVLWSIFQIPPLQ